MQTHFNKVEFIIFSKICCTYNEVSKKITIRKFPVKPVFRSNVHLTRKFGLSGFQELKNEGIMCSFHEANTLFCISVWIQGMIRFF